MNRKLTIRFSNDKYNTISMNKQISLPFGGVGKFLILLLSISFFTFSNSINAQLQYGTVKGTVYEDNGEPSAIAVVKLLAGTSAKYQAKVKVDGTFIISNVEPGTYTLLVTALGQKDYTKQNYAVRPNEVKTEEITLGADATELDVTIIESEPVFTKSAVSQKDFGAESIQKSGLRNVNQIAALTGGAFSIDGGTPSFRGARSSGTIYYVDGVRLIGAQGVPPTSIENLSVLTGGIPAEFGDATGGIISITTKGPTTQYFGGIEGLTSQFLDGFGYNNIEGSLSGPIWMKNKGTDSARSLLGFFLGGNYTSVAGDAPAFDVLTASDQTLRSLENNPIVNNPLGQGFTSASRFVTRNDMTAHRFWQNTASWSGNLTGRLDFQPIFTPTSTLNITAGGQINRNAGNALVGQFAMFNYENNPRSEGGTNRGYVRLRQTFAPSSSSSKITSAYYTIQGDFTRTNGLTYNEEFGEDFFKYGYLGQFIRYREPAYFPDTRNVPGVGELTANYLVGYRDTAVAFIPGDVNTVTQNYTRRFFENQSNQITNLPEIQAGGALLNGQNPQLVYSLYSDVGTEWGNYQKTQQDMITINANGGVVVNGHNIKFGLQFEQRFFRSYSLNGLQGLWFLARQRVNEHLTVLDTTQPIYDTTKFENRIDYPFIVGDNQSNFDRNLRNHLINIGATDEYGRPINEQSLINVDQYSWDNYRLDYFSANELLNNGNNYVNYLGYDHLGNIVRGNPGIDDFLDSSKRTIGAFQPIYTAGFIQDQFTYKDLIVSVGVRVDGFNANQPVLKDPFSLYPTRNAGEITLSDGSLNINGRSFERPGNIDDDYVVYVDNPTNPTRLIGFRDGLRWFDENGAEVEDPQFLANQTQTGVIAPYLQATSQDQVRVNAESFRPYETQINVMPRVALSFPISDEAIFFANYDVLTQRPLQGNVGAFTDYFYLVNRATQTIANPNLLPETRTNYEVGFKQRIGLRSALSLNAFYGEMRNMVQLVRVNQAYPISYSTLDNIDFGTVKGLTIGYDFKRRGDKMNGINITTNYTLQFADGTGSSATTAAGIVNAGLPNLRTPFPLSFDVRNTFVGQVDYRFGARNPYTGKDDYVGPVVMGKRILENAGINFLFNVRSGTPYSQQTNVTRAVAIGVADRSNLAGTINGSRLPWQTRLDLSIDKDFYLQEKKIDEKTKKIIGKNVFLNVYLSVQNVLDAQNVIGVYRYTGLADDDGYLASDLGQRELSQVESAQAYSDLYTVRVSNPNNFANPRLVRLGARLNFN